MQKGEGREGQGLRSAGARLDTGSGRGRSRPPLSLGADEAAAADVEQTC